MPNAQATNSKLQPKKASTDISLEDQYQIYLANIITNSKANAKQQIAAIKPDYSSMGVEEKRDFVSTYKNELMERARQFRQAIANDDKELAAKLGKVY